MARMSDDQVSEILALLAAGVPMSAVARANGLSVTSINKIRNGEHYKHVPGPRPKPSKPPLTEAQAESIYREYVAGATAAELGLKYNRTRLSIYNIASGVTFPNLAVRDELKVGKRRRGRAAKETRGEQWTT